MSSVLFKLVSKAPILFFEGIWISIKNGVMSAIMWVWFGIIKVIAMVLDMLTQLFFIFAGMTPISSTKITSPDGEAQSIDIVNFFLTKDTFRSAYISLCLIALGLVIVFTIGKIIKQDYFERSGPRSKGPIFRNVALSFIAFICVIPIFTFIINAAGALALLVMKALGYKGGGIGTMLFNLSWSDYGESFISVGETMPSSDLMDPDFFGWYDGNTFYEYYWDTNDGSMKEFGYGTRQAEFYWYIFLFAGLVLISNLFKMILAMITRIFKLIALFIIAPSPISQIVLDDGQKFKDWKNSVLQEALKVVGCITSFMIFVLVSTAINDIDLMRFAFTDESASAKNLLEGNYITAALNNEVSALYYGNSSEAGTVDNVMSALGKAMLLIAGVGAVQDMDSVITPLLSGGKASMDLGATGQAISRGASAAAKGALELTKGAVGLATGLVGGGIRLGSKIAGSIQDAGNDRDRNRLEHEEAADSLNQGEQASNATENSDNSAQDNNEAAQNATEGGNNDNVDENENAQDATGEGDTDGADTDEAAQDATDEGGADGADTDEAAQDATGEGDVGDADTDEAAQDATDGADAGVEGDEAAQNATDGADVGAEGDEAAQDATGEGDVGDADTDEAAQDATDGADAGAEGDEAAQDATNEGGTDGADTDEAAQDATDGADVGAEGDEAAQDATNEGGADGADANEAAQDATGEGGEDSTEQTENAGGESTQATEHSSGSSSQDEQDANVQQTSTDSFAQRMVDKANEKDKKAKDKQEARKRKLANPKNLKLRNGWAIGKAVLKSGWATVSTAAKGGMAVAGVLGKAAKTLLNITGLGAVADVGDTAVQSVKGMVNDTIGQVSKTAKVIKDTHNRNKQRKEENLNKAREIVDARTASNNENNQTEQQNTQQNSQEEAQQTVQQEVQTPPVDSNEAYSNAQELGNNSYEAQQLSEDEDEYNAVSEVNQEYEDAYVAENEAKIENEDSANEVQNIKNEIEEYKNNDAFQTKGGKEYYNAAQKAESAKALYESVKNSGTDEEAQYKKDYEKAQKKLDELNDSGEYVVEQALYQQMQDKRTDLAVAERKHQHTKKKVEDAEKNTAEKKAVRDQALATTTTKIRSRCVEEQKQRDLNRLNEAEQANDKRRADFAGAKLLESTAESAHAKRDLDAIAAEVEKQNNQICKGYGAENMDELRKMESMESVNNDVGNAMESMQGYEDVYNSAVEMGNDSDDADNLHTANDRYRYSVEEYGSNYKEYQEAVNSGDKQRICEARKKLHSSRQDMQRRQGEIQDIVLKVSFDNNMMNLSGQARQKSPTQPEQPVSVTPTAEPYRNDVGGSINSSSQKGNRKEVAIKIIRANDKGEISDDLGEAALMMLADKSGTKYADNRKLDKMVDKLPDKADVDVSQIQDELARVSKVPDKAYYKKKGIDTMDKYRNDVKERYETAANAYESSMERLKSSFASYRADPNNTNALSIAQQALCEVISHSANMNNIKFEIEKGKK